MVKFMEDDILHIRTRGTNKVVPFTNYIGVDRFPEQDTSILGTTVTVSFRNMNVPDIVVDDSELADQHDIFVVNAIVVRCDKEEPYQMICLTKNYTPLVCDSRHWEETVMQYPIQYPEYIGIKTKDQYLRSDEQINGITLRVDEGEPCLTVLAEYVDENTVRFVLGDECISYLVDYYRISESDNEPLEYIKHQITIGSEIFYVNRGVYDRRKRTKYTISNLVKEILKGKMIYGASKDWTF